MIRGLSRASFAAWLLGAFTAWSCSSGPGSVADAGGQAGASGTASGGAASGVGGSSAGMSGTLGLAGASGAAQPMAGRAGEVQSSANAGASGSSARGGSDEGGARPSSESGGASDGGATSSAESGAGETSQSNAAAGAAGAGESGAAGSSDSAPPFEGHCGQGWAAGGTAPAPHLEGTVTPQAQALGDYSFQFGRYRFVVAGARGARIVEFSLDGSNLLDPTGGSTFWPSPQQAYAWPPPAELDPAPYVAESDATSLTLTSATAVTLGLRVRKRFWVNASSGVVSIEYQLINQGTVSASWAPWEVTRVRAGGYTFAPRGPGNRSIVEDSFQHPLPLSLLSGVEWLNYPSLSLTADNYINEFDGAEGWLAHADRLGKTGLPILFVKSFVDAPDASLPANQAEIQLWTSGTANPKLIEVEEQGATQAIAPGAALTWTVRWSACELPSNLVLAAGNSQLLALARAHALKP